MLAGLHHVIQWPEQEGAVVVEVHHTQEFVELDQELLDGFSLRVELGDAFWSNCVTNIGERNNTEFRLVHTDLYAKVLQASENLVKVLSVRSFIRASDEWVINVGRAKG